MGNQDDKKVILNHLDSLYNDIVTWRRHLHANPELSFEETATAKFIADKLEEFNLEVETDVGDKGIVGKLQGNEKGQTILFRADFDALPIQDNKQVTYKSQTDGVMHACGHDGHTAALLGLAKALSQFKEKIKGTIIFLFQPAEEKPPGGAKFMIEAGALNHVDKVYAAHLASDIPLGQFAVGSGFKMAAVDKFKITIKGKGGHGARPHATRDPIVIGSEVVNALQKIVSRQTDPLDSAVVTLGVFQAGQAFNVIPENAILEGTVRTFKEATRQAVHQDIEHIIKHVTEAFHAGYDLDYLFGYPALENNASETDKIKAQFETAFTKNQIIPLETSMGAEDFSYFLNQRPGTYFRVGSWNGKPETNFPHHNENFDIDERALLNIGKAFIEILDVNDSLLN